MSWIFLFLAIHIVIYSLPSTTLSKNGKKNSRVYNNWRGCLFKKKKNVESFVRLIIFLKNRIIEMRRVPSHILFSGRNRKNRRNCNTRGGNWNHCMKKKKIMKSYNIFFVMKVWNRNEMCTLSSHTWTENRKMSAVEILGKYSE